jgi:hypothetical protein
MKAGTRPGHTGRGPFSQLTILLNSLAIRDEVLSA